MKKNNRIIVDLNKVQWALFFYRSQYGQHCNCRLNVPTIRGEKVSTSLPAMSHPDYPGETEYMRAKRLDLLDVWEPVLRLKLTANEYLEYTGEKALSLHEAWKAKIYGNN